MTVLMLLFAFTILLAQPAHAYIDPCAGSYIVQMIFGAALTIGATFNSFIHRRLKANAKAGK